MHIAIISSHRHPISVPYRTETEERIHQLCRQFKKQRTRFTLFAAEDSDCDLELCSVIAKSLKAEDEEVNYVELNHQIFERINLLLEVGDYDLVHNFSDDREHLRALGLLSIPVISNIDLRQASPAEGSFLENAGKAIKYICSDAAQFASWKGIISNLELVNDGYALEDIKLRKRPEKGCITVISDLNVITPELEQTICISHSLGLVVDILCPAACSVAVPTVIEKLLGQLDTLELHDDFAKTHSLLTKNELTVVLPNSISRLAKQLHLSQAAGTPVLLLGKQNEHVKILPGINGNYISFEQGRALKKAIPATLLIDRKKCSQETKSGFGLRQMSDSYLSIYHSVYEQRRLAT